MTLLRRGLIDGAVEFSRHPSLGNSAVTELGLEHFERQAEGFH